MKESLRIKKIPSYIFSRIDVIKNELKDKGIDVIDLGIGDPDIKTPDFILNSFKEFLTEPDFHRYSPYCGIDELKLAVVNYYKKNYGVELDYKSEVAVLIGSKEGIAHIITALTDNGDYIIIPDPGYPVYSVGASLAGCSVFKMLLSERNDYLPRFENIYHDILQKSKLLIINYPNNPTGAVANLNFYNSLIEFCIRNNISLLNDGAYLDICKDDVKISLLQGKNAKDICVETGSFSKSFNMSGWRLGYIAGNSDIIKSLMTIKTNVDSGQFIPIQRAGAYALNNGENFTEYINGIYDERRKIIKDFLAEKGLKVYNSKGAFYIWFKVPIGFRSKEYAEYLLEKYGIIVTPGDAFGNMGEGYCRISLTVGNDKLMEAVERLSTI